jgi:hypothetical protein
MTSSARARIEGGTVRPSACAADGLYQLRVLAVIDMAI